MLRFTADPRDGYTGNVGCQACCCSPAVIMPGETNKWQINYAPWSVPIGGRGLTVNNVYDVEKRVDPVLAGNGAPSVPFFGAVTPLNTTLNGTLTATDPDADSLKFKVLPGYGPANGKLTIVEATGAYTYIPDTGFIGLDTFFFTVSDGVNPPVVGEASIAVQQAGAPANRSTATPIVFVNKAAMVIDAGYHTVEFPIEVSPAAKVGDRYRMTIRQQAMDCDAYYWNVMCIDISVGKC